MAEISIVATLLYKLTDRRSTGSGATTRIESTEDVTRMGLHHSDCR